MKNNKPVLLAEDDMVDAMSVKRAFREIHITNPLIIVENGEEALEYLRNPDNKIPAIILLDLNMPKMNGIEFLKVAKNDEELKRIPVVVFTTSKEEQDRLESFNLGVSGYMIKPVDHNQFMEIIKTIHLYWTHSELS